MIRITIFDPEDAELINQALLREAERSLADPVRISRLSRLAERVRLGGEIDLERAEMTTLLAAMARMDEQAEPDGAPR